MHLLSFFMHFETRHFAYKPSIMYSGNHLFDDFIDFFSRLARYRQFGHTTFCRSIGQP